MENISKVAGKALLEVAETVEFWSSFWFIGVEEMPESMKNRR